ncbi:MAG TPA: class I SAM-dependent methyltransferase [Gammaproteobacteria bacterium]|mgnify:CR=1 FL=1|nr:class I SAM-dependent methyltransferase [Gammaproteobacteria bacterium]
MNDIKKAQEDVRDFWDKSPCDSSVSMESREGRAYFEGIARDRYSHQGHINQIMDWLVWDGKKVLEIGTGVGTDARNIVRRGGLYQGINVDEGSVEITKKAMEVFCVDGEVSKCSATGLCFPDASFDIVYSFGVIHHIPDAKSAVSEIARVLKPGGELLIMVYNKDSINYKFEICVLRKLFVRLLHIPGLIKLFGAMGFPEEKLRRHVEIFSANKKMSDEEWLSRNTDGPDNPYSIVYDEREIEDLLSLFEVKNDEVFYFDARHWGVLGKLLPARLVEFLGTRYGWHRVVYAVKPN